MSHGKLDAEVVGQRAQAVLGQAGQEERSQLVRIERRAGRDDVLSGEKAQVEGDVLPDDSGIARNASRSVAISAKRGACSRSSGRSR